MVLLPLLFIWLGEDRDEIVLCIFLDEFLAKYSIPPEAFRYRNERCFFLTNLCGAATGRVRN